MAEKRRRRESNSRQGRSPCPLSIREHAPSYPSISSLFYHPSSSSPDLPLLYSPYNQPLSSSITFLPRIFSSAFQSRSSIPPPLHLPLPRISSPLSIYPFIIYPGASIFLPPPSFVPGDELFFRGTPLQIYPHVERAGPRAQTPRRRRRRRRCCCCRSPRAERRDASERGRRSARARISKREYAPKVNPDERIIDRWLLNQTATVCSVHACTRKEETRRCLRAALLCCSNIRDCPELTRPRDDGSSTGDNRSRHFPRRTEVYSKRGRERDRQTERTSKIRRDGGIKGENIGEKDRGRGREKERWLLSIVVVGRDTRERDVLDSRVRGSCVATESIPCGPTTRVAHQAVVFPVRINPGWVQCRYPLTRPVLPADGVFGERASRERERVEKGGSVLGWQMREVAAEKVCDRLMERGY